MQLLRRLTVGNGRTRCYFPAELYLLFMMDWSWPWGSLVGFCVELCFSVSRNSVLHACTAILRLVHDSDSGRASACTNFWIFFALDVFSPFAEEGFTCLDHSILGKKKKDHEPAGVGCAPKHSLCGQARAPEPAGPPTTLPITPALGAFIGPKNSIMPCSEPTHASRFCLILMPLGASVTCGVR